MKEICQILPPIMEFDTSNIQGCDRLCNVSICMACSFTGKGSGLRLMRL